jgi:hypothetical protein
MLAYVFWHWPRRDVAPATYEAELAAFHQAMAAYPPDGFLRSAVFAVLGAPWVPLEQSYEDWYLIRDFTALGALNEGAVTAPRKEPHDQAAVIAAGGTAGVYRLVAGIADLFAMRVAAWVSKPAGMDYRRFSELLRPATSRPGVAFWQRQMVLGPTREFCVQSAEKVELPGELAGHELTLRPLWPGRRE